MDYGKLTLEELEKGYWFDSQSDSYICNYCNRGFAVGQVFAIDGCFYLPEQAAAKHIQSEHGGNLAQLLASDSKYNTLTDNQKELLTLFASDMSDGGIAKKLGVSASTIRHQKFTFREKAKQAKLYLAVFEAVFGQKAVSSDTIIPIHNNARNLDERYVITEGEKARILESCFESLQPLRLKVFSAKEKKKVVILSQIAQLFEPGKTYTEKEINQIIQPVYGDYATIRRYLIMYGFLQREKDGSSYWLA